MVGEVVGEVGEVFVVGEVCEVCEVFEVFEVCEVFVVCVVGEVCGWGVCGWLPGVGERAGLSLWGKVDTYAHTFFLTCQNVK